MPNKKYNSLFFKPISNQHKPLVAISACLVGQPVRYDGTDKRLATKDSLSGALQLRPVCPEAGAELGTPRPPVRLVQEQGLLQAIGRDDPTLNVTEALNTFRQQQLQHYLQEPLCGHILKARSPSCGLNTAAIYNKKGRKIAIDSGLYAAYFQQYMPWLFFRDESQLGNSQQCANFITACQLSHDLQQGMRQANPALIKQHYQYVFVGEDKGKFMAGNARDALTLLKQRTENLLSDGSLLADTLLSLQASA